MATTNYERVGKALELLKAGLGPFAQREFESAHQKDAQAKALMLTGDDRILANKAIADWDAAALLRLMWEGWNDVFRRTLGPAERSLVSELRDHRNKWAHQQSFSGDDAYRVLDSTSRLLSAVSAPQVEDVERMKLELLRVRFEERTRSEMRRSAGTAIESAAAGALTPWREVITPHKDVASGRYQQAEFAADLWQVHVGEGSPEYKDPVEFFRRTYLTESLKSLLANAVARLSGKGGDPVVQLQTNFGGGKTHSMLALYHLFSGAKPGDLDGIDAVLAAAQANGLPEARRVVLVGNRISPGNPTKKPDGTVVRTLWGEVAYQLGGRKAYERVRADDERATSPGDALRELFNEYGPCLILIDEWVAYARQLHDDNDLPAGSFDTQFSFAQALTESAKVAKNCLVVISLPASDTGTSPHAQADDIEVGGLRGRDALDRLRNVVGRVESTWRPASAEEGFEIVRRRLFEPMSDQQQFTAKDVVARKFGELYRTQQQEFPPACREADYERRIQAAYPIHPEVFDRLYTDWSTLVKFQRTRGVLRLMAAVIHSLWEKGDKNPLILPANIPIDDPRVQFELTRYLSDSWAPIIEKDVDGPGSLPLRIDGEVPNLGKYAAARRVARTIYMGSAPTTTAAHRGLEDRHVKLGCVMPGESPAVFGDALRRLAAAATYLYGEGSRYWYSTQPTVTKLAEDRAEQLKSDPDKAVVEIERRVREDLKKRDGFERIHAFPGTSGDVPDDLDARLVVLGVQHPYSKETGNAAETEAKAILESRGNAPRLYRNTLVFLAADKVRLQDLDAAARLFLAWQSVLAERDALNLDPHQVRQAETQRSAAESTLAGRIPETFQWLLVPGQADPQAPLAWQATRLSGQEALAVRASRRLRSDESMISSFAASRLRMELDRVPLWRGDHVAVKQLLDDFGRYLYLPRLSDPAVLLAAISEGLSLTTWEFDSFAYADDFDAAAKRYRALRCLDHVTFAGDCPKGLLVKPDVAKRYLDAEEAARAGAVAVPSAVPIPGAPAGPVSTAGPAAPATPLRPTRYYATAELDGTRLGRDFAQIAEEVVAHLAGLVGASVKVTLEIEAELPAGFPENVVRTVTENGLTLKFSNQGFERD